LIPEISFLLQCSKGKIYVRPLHKGSPPQRLMETKELKIRYFLKRLINLHEIKEENKNLNIAILLCQLPFMCSYILVKRIIFEALTKVTIKFSTLVSLL